MTEKQRILRDKYRNKSSLNAVLTHWSRAVFTPNQG